MENTPSFDEFSSYLIRTGKVSEFITFLIDKGIRPETIKLITEQSGRQYDDTYKRVTRGKNRNDKEPFDD